MNLTRRAVVFGLAAFSVISSSARAQQVRTSYRIGFLSPFEQTYQIAFKESLLELGYVEGQRIVIERRFSGGIDERLYPLALELVQLNVDVIVATNSTATAAAIKATRAIPIVMVTGSDPVEAKFVSSLARPGGNVTGTTSFASDVGLKELEVLRETLPKIKRLAVISDRSNPSQLRFLDKIRAIAQTMRIALDLHEVRTPADLRPAFDAISKSRADALLVPTHPVTIAHRKEIISFAAQRRLPTIYGLKEFAEDGGLMSFGVNFADLYRRAAVYVHKILMGAKPSDIPVEQPTRFDLVVNLKTAKTLGLKIPQSVLLRADRVIE
jgi:putative tryptophan/tyrosine transport system substrate-binding protein